MAQRFNSFKAISKFFGVKTPKARKEKPMKCSFCGGEMHRVEGTNVWACGNPYIVDTELNGQPIQVFGTSCSHTEIIGE